MKVSIVFISCLFYSVASALVPLKGIVKGEVEDVVQYDPLTSIFSQRFNKEDPDKNEKRKFKIFEGMFNQAVNLLDSCQVERYYNYPAKWEEDSAKRSVVGALQFVGLDHSVKAIAKYSRTLDISEESYRNLVNNLVVNTCSENITVYSKKLLKNNLLNYYQNDVNFEVPSLKGSPYFGPDLIVQSESVEAKKKELNYAIKSFRALCSWDGDTDNYALLPPFLQNPIVMAQIINHMTGKDLRYKEDIEETVLKDVPDTAKVACENLVCRKRSDSAFTRLFPRMVGSTDLRDDLELLYCNHFRETSIKTLGASKTVKRWIKAQSLEESKIQGMYLVSLLSGYSDPIYSAKDYGDIKKMYSKTFENRWDVWSNEKTEQLVLDLLYEESLYVDLAPENEILSARGDFDLVFDFNLGELDREVKVVDKISASFNLKFPKSYFRWIRGAYIQAINKSRYKEQGNLEKRFAEYIDLQLQSKKKYFKAKLWNKALSIIMANELLKRLSSYNGKKFKDLGHEELVVPVKFRFGLFALKYLRDKYKLK
tara:strand:- start:216780 stop:218396 length:1617 start_codon:yes stop_codon:yes gene_type:complete